MANSNNPFGFRPIGRIGGGPYSVTEYAKPATDVSFAIFMFDLVGKVATSGLSPTGLGNPLPGVQSCQGITPGTGLYLGAALNFGAIGTLTPHYVTDEVDMVYIAMVDAVTAITVAAHVGKNANVLPGTGNARTKQSTATVNHTGIAVTAGLDLRIQAVSNISPNVEGVNAIVEVVILKHQLGQGTAGV